MPAEDVFLSVGLVGEPRALEEASLCFMAQGTFKQRPPTFSIMGSRRIKFLLDSQTGSPSHPGIESRPGLKESFPTLLLNLPPHRTPAR